MNFILGQGNELLKKSWRKLEQFRMADLIHEKLAMCVPLKTGRNI